MRANIELTFNLQLRQTSSVTHKSLILLDDAPNMFHANFSPKFN